MVPTKRFKGSLLVLIVAICAVVALVPCVAFASSIEEQESSELLEETPIEELALEDVVQSDEIVPAEAVEPTNVLEEEEAADTYSALPVKYTLGTDAWLTMKDGKPWLYFANSTKTGPDTSLYFYSLRPVSENDKNSAFPSRFKTLYIDSNAITEITGGERVNCYEMVTTGDNAGRIKTDEFSVWHINPEYVQIVGTNLKTFGVGYRNWPTYTMAYLKEVRGLENQTNLTKLSRWAFFYSPNLKTVTLPSTIESIDEYAFTMCNSINSIVFEEGSPDKNIVIPTLQTPTTAFTELANNGGWITVPAGATNAFKQAWPNWKDRIKPGPISKASEIKVSGLKESYEYTGKPIQPQLTFTWRGIDITESLEVSVDYKNNTNAGTASVTITGISPYFTGSKTLNFKITKSIWNRLAGSNALGTMKAIVQEGFASTSTVVIATNSSYKDALSASALAGMYGAPILLTNPKSLPSQTASEISRLGASRAIIVGGTLAVDSAVESRIKNLGLTTIRVAGKNAADTSREVAKKVESSQTVIIATSKDFADALSIAPWAYAKQAPIILTESNGTLSKASLSVIAGLGAKKAVIVGGTSAVSKNVETQLKKAKLSVVRLGGKTAVETSALIAQWELKNGFTLSSVGVATRKSFKDALTGAALMGRNAGPLILVNGSNYSAVKQIIQGQASKIKSGYFFGGEKVVTKDVATKIEKIK